jgi:sirohydrochlorin cobaltochelatase
MTKKALLIVSLGVTKEASRKVTLDRYEEEIKATFSDYDIFKAYSSRRIIGKIKKRENIMIHTPYEALEKISADYDEIIVQPFGLICGETFEALEDYIKEFKSKVSCMKLVMPLLHPSVDYKMVAKLITQGVKSQNPKEGVVFVGHGTDTDAQQSYVELDKALDELNINVFLGTIKGDLSIEKVSERLKANGILHIQLRPLLLTSGYHVTKDISQVWTKGFEAKGYQVQVKSKTLAEYLPIRQQFIEQVRACIKE